MGTMSLLFGEYFFVYLYSKIILDSHQLYLQYVSESGVIRQTHEQDTVFVVLR